MAMAAPPEAQRVPASAVVPGDTVVAAVGPNWVIADIQLRRVRGSEHPLVWIKARQGIRFWQPWVFLDETVTIIPSLAAREAD